MPGFAELPSLKVWVVQEWYRFQKLKRGYVIDSHNPLNLLG